VLHQRKLEKMAEERAKAALAREQEANKKKLQADARLKEEHRTLQALQDQIEQDKRDKQAMVEKKKKQYEAVLVENEKDLERKRMQKEKEKEEDVRLAKMQLEMAEKTERERQKREEERQRKLKAAERMAEVQGNNAAELERQTEERVRRAQEALRQKELERERSKREKQKHATSEMMGMLQKQIHEREVEKEKAKAAERARALEMQKEAEAWQKEQQVQRAAKKERQNGFRQNLDQQRAMKEMQSQHASGMSEVELRLNASFLKQVVAEQVRACIVRLSLSLSRARARALPARLKVLCALRVLSSLALPPVLPRPLSLTPLCIDMHCTGRYWWAAGAGGFEAQCRMKMRREGGGRVRGPGGLTQVFANGTRLELQAGPRGGAKASSMGPRPIKPASA